MFDYQSTCVFGVDLKIGILCTPDFPTDPIYQKCIYENKLTNWVFCEEIGVDYFIIL